MSDVKICGITTKDALEAAVEAGTRHIGFVFYEESPRNIDPNSAAELIAALPKSVRSVGVFVDPTDKQLEKVLEHARVHMIQLHGNETPERVMEIKEATGLPVMKAIRVATKYDMEGVEDYEATADWLLFDSKPADADLPGGTGQAFDWSVLKGRSFKVPWMLSGGLTHENVGEAIALLNPKVVDVSSGVEDAPGEKNPDKIKEFISVVKSND